jgi:hypothetical protein
VALARSGTPHTSLRLGRQVARDATEYNTLNKSVEWTEGTFLSGWFPIAIGNGLTPRHDQCLGWKVHPIVGGAFAVDNLGQLHRQIRRPR